MCSSDLIAALGARVLGHFVGDLGEILAALHALEHVLGLVLRRNENVACMNLRRRLLGLRRVVIDLAHRRFGLALLGQIAEEALHHHLVLVILHFANDFGTDADAVRRRFLGDELEIDQVVDRILLALGFVQLLRQRRAEVLERDLDVIVGDLEADITKNKISISSPLAKALLGKRVDDTAEVRAPRGVVEYLITEVRY